MTRTLGQSLRVRHRAGGALPDEAVPAEDADGDGLLTGRLRRDFNVGSEAEGCVVDDAAARLYISQEDVAPWRYGADPGDASSRVVVDTVVSSGGRLDPDLEGVTVSGNRLIVSAQSTQTPSQSYFAAYDRQTNQYVGAFRVTDGATSDDCDGIDGIAAHRGHLTLPSRTASSSARSGTTNRPAANQNFKYVRWGALP